MENINEVINFIQTIRKKADQNKLIEFVGAGASRNVPGMPSWFELVLAMAKEIDYKNCKRCKNKSADCHKKCRKYDKYPIPQDDYLKIPQYVFNNSPSRYMEIVQENIGEGKMDSPIANTLFELLPNHIITTNYDKLIESASNDLRTGYEVITKDKDLLVANKSKYIIKLHGDINNLKEIVLKEADYLEYSQRHVLMEIFVKSLLADHIIMFLGYSLNDYNIKLIISWINYIRQQSKAYNKIIGYMILDEKSISEEIYKYYKNNNITIININKLPLVNDIPNELSSDKGKRLFSLLKMIENEKDEKALDYVSFYNRKTKFLKDNFMYVDTDYLCKELCISNYKIDKYCLILEEQDYNNLAAYFEHKGLLVHTLSKFFVNSGVNKIIEKTNGDSYILGDLYESLEKNKKFEYYISKDFVKLKSEIESKNMAVLENSFYYSLIYGRNNGYIDFYDTNLEEIEEKRRVAFLFNKEVIKAWNFKNHSDKLVKKYIDALSSLKVIDGYRAYNKFLELYDGNSKLKDKIEKSFEAIDQYYNDKNRVFYKDILVDYCKAKRDVTELYVFYFINNLFFVGYRDLKDIVKYYAKIIMISNEQHDEKKAHFFDDFVYQKAPAIDCIDIDMLTSVLAVKDLNTLFNEHETVSFNVDSRTATLICEGFKNLVDSIVKLELLNVYLPAINTLINYMQVLVHMELSDKQKQIVLEGIKVILGNKKFTNFYFSINCLEWRIAERKLYELMTNIDFLANIRSIKYIIDNPNLMDYMANTSIPLLEKIIRIAAGEKVSTSQKSSLLSYVLNSPEYQQVKLMRVLYGMIKSPKVDSLILDYLDKNFDKLSNDDLFDFVVSKGLLKLSEHQKNSIIDKALRYYDEYRISGVKRFPDPVNTTLELIIILYLLGEITDISRLKDIEEENEFLKFFDDPSSIDYSKVDFSNYMWENIIRNDKYRAVLLQYKKLIIPNIEKKVKLDKATEVEKVFLYGYLYENPLKKI